MIERKIFEQTENGIIIRLKIIPNSSKNEIIKENDILKIKLTAQPIENKANKALIEFVSKKLKIAKTSIQILKGQTSKEKTIFIENGNLKDFEQFLN
jgi:uncharacterized protein